MKKFWVIPIWLGMVTPALSQEQYITRPSHVHLVNYSALNPLFFKESDLALLFQPRFVNLLRQIRPPVETQLKKWNIDWFSDKGLPRDLHKIVMTAKLVMTHDSEGGEITFSIADARFDYAITASDDKSGKTTVKEMVFDRIEDKEIVSK